MIALLIRLTRPYIQYLPLLALFIVFIGPAQAQSVSSGGCLYFSEVGSGCPVEVILTATADGASIDTFVDAEVDAELDYGFDITIDAHFSGPGVGDSQSSEDYGGASVELDDLISSSFPAQYSSTASVEACDDFDDDAATQNGAAPQEIVSECSHGSYSVSISATVPNVTSVSPNSVTIGTSGTLTLTGSNFIDMFGETPTLANIPGLALTLISVSNNQATVSYNATNAGQFSIGLVGLFGEGAQQTFTVIDPTPTVSSVSPSAWNSGTTTPVTISGSGFGTKPSVTIMGPGVTGYSITGVSDTQIFATVTVATLVVGQTATVQVLSNGYGGKGFLGSPGQLPSASATASLIPKVATPQILFFGVPITGERSVVAGQEMSLSIQQPPGSLIAISGSFSSSKFSPFEIPVAINGWAPTTAQATAPTYTTNASATPTSTSADPFCFYWISGGKFTVDYEWLVQDVALGQASGAASITFIVAAPPGPAITVNGGLTADGTSQVIPETLGMFDRNNGKPTLTISGIPCCSPSVDIGLVGISFGPPAQAEDTSGTYSWVQLITSDTVRLLTGNGPVTCTAVPKADYIKTFPYLDHKYPYSIVEPATQTAHDNPTLGLSPGDGEAWGEASRVFSATMFLLWEPTSGDECTHAAGFNASLLDACTVPVPQGFVNWGLGGDTANTLSPTQMNTTFTPPTISTWAIDLDKCSNLGYHGGFTPSLAYPAWTMVAGQSDIPCK